MSRESLDRELWRFSDAGPTLMPRAPGPASEKQQGMKPQEIGCVCHALYGDFGVLDDDVSDGAADRMIAVVKTESSNVRHMISGPLTVGSGRGNIAPEIEHP